MTANEMKIGVGFEFVDADGSAPIHDVAEHAHRVGKAWIELGFAMQEVAEKLDRMVRGGTPDVVACEASTGWHDDGDPMLCTLPEGHDGGHMHHDVPERAEDGSDDAKAES